MGIFSRFLVLFTTFVLIKSQTYSYTEDDQVECLDWHNDERSTTASGSTSCSSGSPNTFDTTCPSGTIPKLRWDQGLADVAQEYAEDISGSCSFTHSSNSWRSEQMLAQTNTNIDYTSGEWIGENLAASWSSGSYPTGTGVYSGWVDSESGIFNYGSDEPQTCIADGCNSGNGMIGHFTQVVAERSRYLGCGFAGNVCDNMYRSTVVCMYYPGGNYGSGSSSPYTSDGTCGSCETGETCENNLCYDGTNNGFGTPEPTPPTPNPTTAEPTATTTRQPTVVETIPADGNTDLGSNANSVVIQNCQYTSLNNVPGSADTSDGSEYPAYGPIEAYGLTFYFRYEASYNDWNLYDSSGTLYSYSNGCSTGENCVITSRSSWNGVLNGANVMSTADGFSTSSSSSNKDDRLVEGLLIGIGVTIGIFIISVCVFLLIKRRNSKSQYSVVEMNNEISNHDYVNMEN